MYVVTVTRKDTGKTEITYGPYRIIERAWEIRDLCINPSAIDFYGSDTFNVEVVELRKYGA